VPQRPVTVVGVGADGWAGLAPSARRALTTAAVVVGGRRQLDLLPADVRAERVAWPAPLVPALPGLVAAHRERGLAVLASGDPMWFGIGTTLAGLLGPDALRIHPAPSSMSLACARLGWPVESVEVVSIVGRPLAAVRPAIQPGRRLLVLTATATGAADLAALLTDRGYGASRLVALAQLGGPDERIATGSAAAWTAEHDALTVVAVECVADPKTLALSRTPGLPDDAYEHDGQLTKREVRAVSLAALAPVPGQLLWDVGAGSGSIGIEWMRVHPESRAIAVEPRADRRERILRNAVALGVPALQVVAGAAPEALDGLPSPDAIFVGGGVSVPGVLEACVAALRPGGRLVANGVTLETESLLAAKHAQLGGSLVRIALERAEPIGGFTGWAPARTVTQWTYVS
jgi:precorrin-6Y C5,15-methyltransferase (decarboxylating)